MREFIHSLFRYANIFLRDIPKQGRSRYEIYQIKIFNQILLYTPLVALAAVLLLGWESNFIERIALVGILAAIFWGLIWLNKSGFDHIARPIYITTASLANGYIAYREGHQINVNLFFFLLPMLGFAITPRRRLADMGFNIAFPLAVLVCTLWVDIPWIKTIQRPKEEIQLYANISTLVFFVLFVYAAWLLADLNHQTYEQLISKIENNRKIQQKLLKQAKELRIAQQLAKIGFWELNAKGSIYCSKEACEILHVPFGEKITRQTIAALVHPEEVDFVIQNLLRNPEEGNVYTFSFRLNPKYGERWVAISCIEATFIPEYNAFHSKGIVQDITAVKQTEQQLLQTIAEKDRILATVSHDLRSPIATTLQLLDLAAKELRNANYSRGHKLLLEYQEMMRQSQQRTLSIIEDLLELCTQKNIVHLSGQPTDLFSLVEQTVNPQIYRATKKGILLQLKPAKHDIIINAVPDKIARALENLLVNAIKFTPMGGKITVSVEKSEGFALVAVADTGIGIPDELKKHLFEQSGVARRHGTEGENSTGLGLSIVKQWVEMHNGTIWCEDNKPQGTVFYMSFPLIIEDKLPNELDNNRLATTF
ncbi:MAG: ATP-binding protein [Cytophagales bacterium]|nr:ATP-binding protein [Bernardetiaceae bacterium]MDW8203730.1 ATP-binding protein [Cytophagales bacterium]